jgi:RNA polymerase sigma-70 factor (ECF subfamily)
MAARGGCASSVGRLAERYRRYLLHVAHESLSPALRVKVGASDIVQETLLHFQDGFERFEGTSEAELLAWLRRILYFRALEVARRYSTVEARDVRRELSIEEIGHSGRFAPLVDSAPTPCTELVAKEQLANLAWAIAALPRESRELLRLRNAERLSFQEIGELFDCSPDAARKRWVRVLAQLRIAMSES